MSIEPTKAINTANTENTSQTASRSTFEYGLQDREQQLACELHDKLAVNEKRELASGSSANSGNNPANSPLSNPRVNTRGDVNLNRNHQGSQGRRGGARGGARGQGGRQGQGRRQVGQDRYQAAQVLEDAQDFHAEYTGGRGGGRHGGRKGTSANHLLNFKAHSAAGGSSASLSGVRGVRGGQHHRQPGGSRRNAVPQRFNKELFLQANFRFLVLTSPDTPPKPVTNADDMVLWDDILQVEVVVEDAEAGRQCPVCLDSPMICPQITRCGHVFCFCCIMRHLCVSQHRSSSGDLMWTQLMQAPRVARPCPLCFAPCSVSELRQLVPVLAGTTSTSSSSSPSNISSSTQAGLFPESGPLAAGDSLRLCQLVRMRTGVLPSMRQEDESCLEAARSRGLFFPPAVMTLTTFPSSSSSSSSSANSNASSGKKGKVKSGAVTTTSRLVPSCAPHAKCSFLHDPALVTEPAIAQLTDLAEQMVREGGSDNEQSLPFVQLSIAAMVQRLDAFMDRRNANGHQAIPGGSRQPSLGSNAPAPSGSTSSLTSLTSRPSQSEMLAAMAQPQFIGSDVDSNNKGPSNDSTGASVDNKGVEEDDKWPSLPPPSVPTPIMKVTPSEDESADAASQKVDISSPKGLGSSASNSERKVVGKALEERTDGASDGASDGALNGGREDSIGVVGSDGNDEVGSPAEESNEELRMKELTADESEVYCYYQAEDGRMLILHPLNMRCLHNQYGSYGAMPTTITGVVLEVESHLQSWETRKRFKFLSHLPLTSHFSLCELKLPQEVLHTEGLSEKDQAEIKARAARRQQKEKKERDVKRREAREARAARENRLGPSQAELANMPTLTHRQSEEADNLDLDLEIAMGMCTELPASSPPSAPDPGVSFARMAEMGYASGYNAPALGGGGGSTPGSYPPATSSSSFPSSPPVPRSGTASSHPSWGSKGSWGSVASASCESSVSQAPKGRKGNKGKQKVLMLSTSQRGRS